MKRFFVSAAVALLLASTWSDGASAQRRGFGGGARIGGGAFHGGGMGIGGGAFRGGALGFAGRPGWGAVGRPGWGFPLAVGVGLGSYGYASSGYSDCLSWDGYQWVNVCYQPYGYSYW